MSEGCASEDLADALTSFDQRANNAINVVLAFFAVLFTIIAIRVLVYHCVFHHSTRLLLFSGLFYASLYEICTAYSRTTAFYRSMTFASFPCSLMISASECQLETRLIHFGVAGLVFSECALTIDRILATFAPQIYESNSNWPGICLIVFAGVGSILSQTIVFWNEPFTGFVTHCIQPPDSSFKQTNFLLSAYTLINVVNIVLNVALIAVNRREDHRGRLHYDVTVRYRLHETLITSQAVAGICIAQFVALGFYSFSVPFIILNLASVLYLRNIKERIGEAYFFRIVVWANTVPLAAVSLPLLTVLSVSMVSRQRKNAIKVVTRKRETVEEHMHTLKSVWN